MASDHSMSGINFFVCFFIKHLTDEWMVIEQKGLFGTYPNFES